MPKGIEADEAGRLFHRSVEIVFDQRYSATSVPLERLVLLTLASQMKTSDRAAALRWMLGGLVRAATEYKAGSEWSQEWTFRHRIEVVRWLSEQHHSDLSDDDWQAVRNAVQVMAQEPSTLNAAVHLLWPVPARLAANEARAISQGLIMRIRSLPNGCHEPTHTEPARLARSDFTALFEIVGEKLMREDAMAAAGDIVTLLGKADDYNCSDALPAIPVPLDSPDSIRKFQQFFETHKRANYSATYAAVTRGLASKLTGAQAATALTEALEVTKPYPSDVDRDRLADIVAVLGARLDREQQLAVVNRLTSRLAVAPYLPCRALVPFVHSDTLATAVEVVRWPTCQERDKLLIIEQISRVTGELFGASEAIPANADDGRLRSWTDRPDKWRFASWAESRGFQVRGQPSRASLAH
jgi:hypothetical protein